MSKANPSNPSAALVTGASRGLGAGMARALLSRGYQVFGCGRSDRSEVPAQAHFHYFPLDVTDAHQGPAVLKEELGKVECLDTVVLNAGILGNIRDLRETPLKELREVMETNLWANKWILDELLQRWSPIRQVVAISSGASVSGLRGWGGYGLSKAALNMLIKLYAAECGKTHFSAFAPGLIATQMQDDIAAMPEDERYPTIERLKEARGTAGMPDANEAGEKVVAAFDRLLRCENGSFQDIRKLGEAPSGRGRWDMEDGR